jgi:hypothetical protein
MGNGSGKGGSGAGDNSRSQGRGSGSGSEKGSGKGSGSGSEKGSGRGSGSGSEKGSGNGSGGGSEKGSGNGSGGGSKKGSGSGVGGSGGGSKKGPGNGAGGGQNDDGDDVDDNSGGGRGNRGPGGTEIPKDWLGSVRNPPEPSDQRIWTMLNEEIRRLAVARSVTFAPLGSPGTSLEARGKKHPGKLYGFSGRCVVVDTDGRRRAYSFSGEMKANNYDLVIMDIRFSGAGY